MNEILLIRHGETACNRQNLLCGGGLDSPLSEKGIAQSQALAQSPHFTGITHIWSSTLKRAFQTAQFIAAKTGIEIAQSSLLVEQHGGVWEGKSFEELYKYKNEVWIKTHNPNDEFILEGGETRQQVIARCQKFIELLIPQLTDNAKVVIVTHGAWIENFLHSVAGLDYAFLRKLHIDNCSISRIEYQASKFTVRSLNEIAHLYTNPQLLPVRLLRV